MRPNCRARGRTAGHTAPAAAPAAASGSPVPFPSRDELVLAWGDHVISKLPQRARARFLVGRFTGTGGERALFALPNALHRDRCREVVQDVEEVLSAHFGRSIRLTLVVDGGASAPPLTAPTPDEPPPPDEEDVLWEELTDAPPAAVPSPIDHVLQAFQGAEVVED